MTEARRQKSDDLLHVQSIPQKNRAEHADLSSVFCPLFSVIWILKPEVGRATVPAGFASSRTPEYGRHGGRPYLKNRRMSNIQPQNYEGWSRYALSFYTIDRIHYFVIRYS